jgi:hypothetical protein
MMVKLENYENKLCSISAGKDCYNILQIYHTDNFPNQQFKDYYIWMPKFGDLFFHHYSIAGKLFSVVGTVFIFARGSIITVIL